MNQVTIEVNILRESPGRDPDGVAMRGTAGASAA